MKITWPALTFGPVNLLTVCPAWFFYATQEEKLEFQRNILER